MAWLTKEKRKKYFKFLGLGEYNDANIKKLQKKYFTRGKDITGKYDTNTDILLRHCYRVRKYTKDFAPEEFKCGCGGRYCTGYPTYMKSTELANLQTIRSHYGKPMQITSGLRCKGFNNSLSGSSKNSKHLTGYAADFYIAGVTDTVSRRKSLISYLKKLPFFNWSYGNGWCSLGYGVNAPNMGNAVHMDSKAGTVILKKTTADKVVAKADALIRNGFKYVFYKTDSGYPKNGGNCIRFVACCLKGGGINVSTKQDGLLNNAFANRLLRHKKAVALRMWKERNGKNWKIIKNSGKKIPTSMLKKSDVLLCYSGTTYTHTALYKGDGKIADCISYKGTGASTRSYSTLQCKLAFRYTK